MPRKHLKNKKKLTTEISPMRALLLRSATRHFKDDLNSTTERILRNKVLSCGMDPDEYIKKLNKKGDVIDLRL